MTWNVIAPKKVQKQVQHLPPNIRDILLVLIREIEAYGPVRGNWPNYGALGRNRYHCHLKKGRPTYVVVWNVVDKAQKLVEVSYVGTHENAPY